MALGQLYVDKTFGPEGKERTLKMVQAIEKRDASGHRAADWMSDTTKQQAYEKLNTIVNNIGYPDKWRDYSTCCGQARRLCRQRSCAPPPSRCSASYNKIDKPTDRKDWSMTPPTVNAYYRPTMNDINFPAGILQPPFYSKSMDDAVNYGGIGVVIGHELTHGFDDQGRKFDADGNLKDWWTPEDGKAFEERASCTADEYSSFVAVKDDKGEVKLNGRLTLGENTADNGGLKLAYMALTEHHRQHAGEADRRLHPAAALLPGLWPDLVPERDRSASAQAGAHRSAFARTLAREWRGAELSGFPAGVRMQSRPAHGARERLPCLVAALSGCG